MRKAALLPAILALAAVSPSLAQAPGVFQRFDKNGDGRITKDELPNPETFERFDINKDGAVTLEEFSIALTVGLIAGAYSSIFVAAPILVWLKEHQTKFKVIRERLAAQGVDVRHASARVDLVGATSGSPAIDVAANKSVSGSPTDATPTVVPSGVIPPRPRKNQRKR